MLNCVIVLKVYQICPSRCHGLLKKKHLQLRHTFAISLSMQFNCNLKNGSVVMHFFSTQRSIDGSTSSEPIKLCKTSSVKVKLCKTSSVKVLTDNHTLENQNCSGHHTTLRLPKSLLPADRSPSKSVLRRSQELGINRKTVQRLLIVDLNHWSGYSRAFLTD